MFGRRIAWLVLGLGAMAFGLLGIFLPLLPTTPFLLLAAIGFSRSSPRLHAWLVGHPRYGAMIRNWQRHGAIAPRAKFAAIAVVVATLALSFAVEVAPRIIAIQAVVLAGVAAFILSRPAPPAVDTDADARK